jgi:hypothetical protein
VGGVEWLSWLAGGKRAFIILAPHRRKSAAAKPLPPFLSFSRGLVWVGCFVWLGGFPILLLLLGAGGGRGEERAHTGRTRGWVEYNQSLLR